MKEWASYAERAREALLHRDHDALDQLINANFDLRAKIYRISEGNLQMIRTAREAGATSKFAGSGGAIVGTYRDDQTLERLTRAMRAIGVEVIVPTIAGGDRGPGRPVHDVQ
jgi:glucuronokinase